MHAFRATVTLVAAGLVSGAPHEKRAEISDGELASWL